LRLSLCIVLPRQFQWRKARLSNRNYKGWLLTNS
jgi:hypothetical protein